MKLDWVPDTPKTIYMLPTTKSKSHLFLGEEMEPEANYVVNYNLQPETTFL